MAGRKAVPVLMLTKLPEPMPDSLELVNVPLTVKVLGADGKPVKGETQESSAKFLMPKLSNAGVISYQKLRQEAGATDGNTYVAACVRAAVLRTVGSRIHAGNLDKASLMVAPAPTIRIVDSAQAAGDYIADRIRQGKPLTQDELAALFRGVIPTA